MVGSELSDYVVEIKKSELHFNFLGQQYVLLHSKLIYDEILEQINNLVNR